MKIFYDVDTQKDFIEPWGALALPNGGLIRPNLARLTRYGERNGIHVWSSVCRHFGTDDYKEAEWRELKKWGGPFDFHCMDGNEGQKKIPETIINNVAYVESGFLQRRGLHDVILSKMLLAPQVIFEKQSYSIFPSDNLGGNLNIDRALEMSNVSDVVLYGVATDYCVRASALGFRNRGVNVYVVRDAIEGVNQKSSEEALKEFDRAKITIASTEEVLKNFR